MLGYFTWLFRLFYSAIAKSPTVSMNFPAFIAYIPEIALWLPRKVFP